MRHKRIVCLVLILCLHLLFIGCSQSENSAEKEVVYKIDSAASSAELPHTKVCMEIEDYGSIQIETYPEYAPETVSRFLKLVKDGYYNGFTIDKILPGYIAQTGMSNPDKAIVSNETITGEFYKNGISNEMKFEKGTLAMNHLPENNNSATGAFMIALGTDNQLQGSYAAFAKVVEGINLIDAIQNVTTDAVYKPISPIVMKKVYIVE